MRRPLLLIGLVAAGALAAWRGAWLVRSPTSPVPGATVVQERVAPSLHQPGPRSETASPENPGVPAGVVATRAEVSAPAATGVVLDPSGAPLPGAVVTWTRLPPDLEAGLLVEPSVEEVETLTVSTRSDARGRFSFSEPPPGDPDAASVVWSSEEQHTAAFVWLTGSATPSDLRVILEPSAAAPVLVLEAETPVAGAVVEERGVLQGVTRESLASTLFLRSVRTSTEGRALAFPFDGVVELVARKDRSVSSPVRDVPSGEHVLRLGESFEALGHVVRKDGSALEDPLRVRVALVSGERESSLATLPVAPDGAFGPVLLPHVERAAYSFRTQGGGAGDESTLPSPGVGGRLQVELEVEPGHPAHFVLASEGERLPVGSITLDWQSDDGRKGRVSRAVDDRGEARFTGLPMGSVLPTGHAPHHVSLPGNTFRVPEQTAGAWTVEVFPAGRIAGTVTRHGEPVRDFTVHFWPSGSAYFQQRRSFLGRSDGRFEIEEAPPGEVSIVAWAEEGARSRVAQIHVFPEGQGQPVGLELGQPIAVTGEVVDEQDLPIADASAALFFADQGNLVGPLGLPARSDEQGRFRIENAAQTGAVCVVRSPGHSAQRIDVLADGSGTIDLGRIRLVGQQELTIRLSGEGLDPGRFLVAAAGGALPPRAFSADGVARYAGVDAGQYELVLTHPDRSIQWQPVWLRRGEQWSITLSVEGGASLVADLEGELSEDAQPPLALHVTDPAGPWAGERLLQVLGSARGLRIDSLAPGDAIVSVEDASYRPLTRKALRLEPGENRVRLRLDEPPLLVVVVDAGGEPVAGAQVNLYQMPGGADLGSATCDASGLCRFRGAGEGGTHLVATVSHVDHGIASGLPLEVPRNEEVPAVLVLEADASIVLRILDGDEPQPGVIVDLTDELQNGKVLATSAPSDADGLVRWDRLAAGSYHAVAHQDPRYWRGDASVTASRDPAPTTLQLRRRGDLRFRVVDESGTSLPNVWIAVISEQYGRPVLDFLPSGFIDVDPASARTNSRGELLFARIPRGRYEWHATLDGGGSHSGEVDVKAWQETVVTVLLDE